jgi:predicted amidohydrolase
MAQVWKTDGSYIRESRDWDNRILVSNPSIENFLDTERDTKYFVVATKGLGKSFLIRFKRILYQDRYEDWNFIPKNLLVDKVTPSIDFDESQISLLKDEEVWKDIWSLSILLSTLKSIKKYRNLFANEEIDEILCEIDNLGMVSKLLKGYEETPLDYLGTILNKGYRGFYLLREELNRLLAVIRGKRVHTAIFIDDVDEIFFKHLKKSDVKSSRVGVLSNDIWYLSQIGLMKAVRTLSNVNPHIRVFSSIRNEAYLRMRDADDMSQQLAGNVLDLKYSKKELKEMFIKNIMIMDSQNLSNYELLKDDPIYSFLGLKSIKHCRTDQPEEIFDYIYRHTLKRPRDIMSMGEALSLLSDKNEDNIARTINTVANDIISSQYISEVSHHIDFPIEEFKKLFDLINTRIIYKDDLKKICSKLNSQISCESKECSKCEKINVFGNLYKIGLLGVIERDNVTGEYRQRFLQPGEMTFENPKCILPQSKFYFIHPILTRRIKYNESKEYQLDKKVIVGDGYLCDPKFMQEYCESYENIEISSSPKIRVFKVSTRKKEIVRVAAVQLNFSLAEDSFPPEIVNKFELKEKILRAIKIALNEGADIVCLPELCIYDDWILDIESIRQDMVVIAGSYYDVENHNICRLLLSSDSNIPSQTKINPSPFEQSYIVQKMVPGNKLYIYNTKVGKFSVLICRDFPNLRHHLRGKIDIIFVPSYNKQITWFHEDANNHISNSPAYVVMSNTSLYGGTTVFGRIRKELNSDLVGRGFKRKDDSLLYKLCELKKGEEGLIIVDFNLVYKSIQVPTPIDPTEEKKPISYLDKKIIEF